MSELLFEHTMPLWLIVSGLGASVLLALLVFWRYGGLSITTLVLAAVRIAFILLLGWCLLRPLLKKGEVEMLKPRFVVAVDTSASMTLAPAPGLPTRWEIARGVLTQKWTGVVSAICSVDVYPFGIDLGAKTTLPQSTAFLPDGKATHLRDSLGKITERYRGQNLAGLLLLSDGLDTRESSDMWTKQTWPCPIYTVRPEPQIKWEVKPDVRVDTVETPRRVTVGWDSELKAVISGEGTKGQVINVQLSQNGTPIQELPTQIPAEGGTREVVFQLKHDAVGSFTYTARVPPLEGEINTNDNVFAVTVQVLDTKNQLLYVEGVPRWESKYLVRSLVGITDITPLSFVQGPDGRFLTYGSRGNVTLDLTEDQLARFKIVILGDLGAEALGEARAAALVKFVDNGGSLVFLGGPNAWGPKGFESTPLEKVLPARRAGTPAAVEGKFALQLTDEGRSHSAFKAEPGLWAALPPVLSIFPGAAAAPGATVLINATAPTGPEPLIVAQRYGQGKVLAILTDSLWRWQLNPGKDNPHFRFWNQVLHWLLPSEGGVEACQIDLFADAGQLFLGESITLNARITSSGKASIEQAPLTCDILTPDERKIPFAMAKQNVTTSSGKSYAGYSMRFGAETSGLFRAVASTTIDGKKYESPAYSFFVKPFTSETNPRSADIAVLKSLASESHGKFCEPEEVDRVLSSLNVTTAKEERVTYRTLWNNAYVIACLILLLAVEWIFRKVRNMA